MVRDGYGAVAALGRSAAEALERREVLWAEGLAGVQVSRRLSFKYSSVAPLASPGAPPPPRLLVT